MPDASPLFFDDDGQPRSRRYGDVYFSKGGGLAETRAVFFAGCGLPERWAGRRRFTLAELGFGTGLNIAALLWLWASTRPPGARLSIFSVEAEPIGAADAARALGAWPELAHIAGLMLARWPGRRSGFQRIDFPELGATLDLAVMDAGSALAAWTGRADAWFLDGFAPAKNPDMWTDALMRAVARASAPGARAATYSVAGQVRRALASAGFQVTRRPGFGAKRERLEARLPGPPDLDPPDPRVAIVGAGIAGAALARALRDHGIEARVFEADRPGAGASGNPAALVTARLDAGLGPAARLHAQALYRARGLYEALDGAVIARGVWQLENEARDAGRFAKIAASGLFEPGGLRLASTEETSAALGEPAPASLEMADALVIDPAAALSAWLGEVETARVARLDPSGGGWRLIGADGDLLAEAEIVCLATGAELDALWSDAPTAPARGQLTFAEGLTTPAAAWSAYMAPAPGGAVFGATFDRGQTDRETRQTDERRNLAALAARLPRLAARAGAAKLSGRASTRATTRDHLPLAASLGDGLFVLGGLGSRGFALAPLLAEHVAALALAVPSPLPADLQPIVEPDRFAMRARASGRDHGRGATVDVPSRHRTGG